MVRETILERVSLADSRIIRFRDHTDKFLLPSSSPAETWSSSYYATWCPWSGSLPRSCSNTHSSMAAEVLSVSICIYPLMPVPMTQECEKCICWWLKGERWSSGIPLQVPPTSLLLYTDASLTGWGAHLLNLTTAEIWSWEKRLHINIFGKKNILADQRSRPDQVFPQNDLLPRVFDTICKVYDRLLIDLLAT